MQKNYIVMNIIIKYNVNAHMLLIAVIHIQGSPFPSLYGLHYLWLLLLTTLILIKML